jgi:hypothetical protein
MNPATNTFEEAPAPARRWRRASFRRLDGSIAFSPDDWCLENSNGQPLARIYRFAYGPNAGRWTWFIQVDLQGRHYNGGTGTAETEREAREACEACEAVVTEGVVEIEKQLRTAR